MNKKIAFKDLKIKDYKETWEYQTSLLQEIVDVKIDQGLTFDMLKIIFS